MEVLTSQQMRRIDRRAARKFGVPEIVLMENAGLRVLETLQRIDGDLKSRAILVLCGRGNNGGDAFVLARHLHNQGIPFTAILFGHRRDVHGSAAINLRALERLGEAHVVDGCVAFVEGGPTGDGTVMEMVSRAREHHHAKKAKTPRKSVPNTRSSVER